MKDAFLLSGAGNRFVLLDCLDGDAPDKPHELVRELCIFDAANDPQPHIDGLLLAMPPEANGDVKMVIYNADGSRPEICGNGLRCLGHWVGSRPGFNGLSLTVETDAGLRTVQTGSEDASVHVHMGRVWVAEKAETVTVLGREIKLMLANVGNPHAVLLVDDLVEAPVQEIGAALQVHERFPDGINVEFVTLDQNEAAVRVYERGVGETLACGSGACAVAGVLRVHAGRPWPIRVRMCGGVLNVTGDEGEGVWLTGSVSEHALDEHTRARLSSVI